ncbi:PD-(D/E)XK nuclease superfamily protein [Bernardetia sp. MNP-M8]|uniref:PD-(D/E)XK nuclease superfamily protein n=1 Tax=Bernardetia sp. MNP-M8 TaxID=3127470 RepID=UPI0030CB9959
MILGGIGGANTQTGLVFEGDTDLTTFLNSKNGYEVKNGDVFYEGDPVARIFKKHGFYKFLEELGIDWKGLISKKLLPDDSIFVKIANTFFVIECKSQRVAGSVDEKLQTCDFKRKQYQKLLAKANIEVEYIYLLNDWFRKPEYKDVLDYIHSVHCYYFFNYIPLAKLGLPIPKEEDKQDKNKS